MPNQNLIMVNSKDNDKNKNVIISSNQIRNNKDKFCYDELMYKNNQNLINNSLFNLNKFNKSNNAFNNNLDGRSNVSISFLNNNSKNNNYLIENNFKPLKVLIFTESFYPYTSGIARRFKEIIERLAKRGFLIHIVTGCKGCKAWTNDSDLKEKVTFSILRAIEFKDKIDCALPFLLPQYGILKSILDFKPDVIHCVEQTPASTLCGTFGKILNIPIVWSSHTNLDYYIPLYIHPIIAPISLLVYQLLRRTYLNLAEYNLTVSEDFMKVLSENGVKKKVYVWKTGVDSESFNPSFRSHEMRLKMFNGYYSPGKILLCSVGRLSPEKNFEFLLNFIEQFPQTFLCFIGGGPYKESLQPFFPSNRTHFMDFLQGEQLASAYASADYFVYASVSETFGQVYLEAMSSGTPIVAAEGKQMREFNFINGIHGYTWKAGDVSGAVKALENAIRERNILSQNCRSNALSHSWNSAANQIAEVYANLIQRNRSKTNKKNGETYILPKKIFKLLIKTTKAIYYISTWLYVTFLVLTLMAPWMKVVRPANTEINSGNFSKKNNKNNIKKTEYTGK